MPSRATGLVLQKSFPEQSEAFSSRVSFETIWRMSTSLS